MIFCSFLLFSAQTSPTPQLPRSSAAGASLVSFRGRGRARRGGSYIARGTTPNVITPVQSPPSSTGSATRGRPPSSRLQVTSSLASPSRPHSSRQLVSAADSRSSADFSVFSASAAASPSQFSMLSPIDRRRKSAKRPNLSPGADRDTEQVHTDPLAPLFFDASF